MRELASYFSLEISAKHFCATVTLNKDLVDRWMDLRPQNNSGVKRH